MKDISEYYTEENALREEAEWAEVKYYEIYHKQVENFIDFILKDSPARGLDIIELGCGSGWIPTLLTGWIRYTGVDKNSYFLKWAREKNRGDRKFIEADIRELVASKLFDLSFSYAFIKHFSLEEIPSVIRKILSLGKYSIIDVQLASEAFDDGKEFHHSFIAEEQVLQIIKEAGHTVLYKETVFEDKAYAFMTKRI